MSDRDVLVLAYKAFGGEMHGKTLLQKRLYFLSIMLDLDLGYDAHFFGPYSQQIADLNSELKSFGYVSESSSPWGYDRRGFEMARYDFGLTDVGARAAERKARQNPDLWRRIERAAEVIRGAGNLDYMELSMAAKAYYILRRLNRRATLEDIKDMLPTFGWSVSDEQLQRATDFLVRAGLVTQALHA
jgi:uncharacterized protein YwgA